MLIAIGLGASVTALFQWIGWRGRMTLKERAALFLFSLIVWGVLIGIAAWPGDEFEECVTRACTDLYR